MVFDTGTVRDTVRNVKGPVNVKNPTVLHEEITQAGEENALLRQLLKQGMRHDELNQLLSVLSLDQRDELIEKMLDLLGKATALLEVYKRVADSLSLDVLLPRMVELISMFMEAERCSIFLYDSFTDTLYSRIAQGSSVAEIRFSAESGIAGATFRSGKAIHIPDAYADERFNREFDQKTGFRTRNIICAPIRDNNSQVIGVVQVLNKISGEFNTEHEIPVLETMAQQASSAFTNAQLHEQIEKARVEEAQLLEVTTAMSQELQLRPLLTKIMQAVTTILEADRSTLFLYDAKSHELWSHIALGMDAKTIRIPASAGIAGSVFTTGETINIPDAYADQRFNKAVDKKTGYKTDSILCMPINNKAGETIGVIQVLNKWGGPFSRDDERKLGAFTAQASVAIENAKMFEDIIEMKNYNESILQSMSNGVLTLDADGIIQKANKASKRILGIKSVSRELIGVPTHELFIDRNSWVMDSVNKVAETGRQEMTMDAHLYLSDLGRVQDEGAGEDEEKEETASSINLTVVPLQNSKKEQIGSMLLIEDISNEKRLKSTMARYMTREVADKLLEEGQDALGGKMQKATVLFTDIRDFTSISERIGAQDTVAMLNEYFSIMVDILLGHGGILDKYIGDAMMAVFGAPFVGEEDADNAVQAGIEMLRALADFNTQRVSEGKDPVRMGVGVNTDDILSGNIGSMKRMDYTVIGDGVNLASRLEGANKMYRTQLLISEFTRADLKHDYIVREIDKIRVKGKNEPVAVYEVLDYYDETTFPNLSGVIESFNRGLELYKARDWNTAIRCFEDALALNPNDNVSKLYINRCRSMIDEPPSADWDGVWTMTCK